MITVLTGVANFELYVIQRGLIKITSVIHGSHWMLIENLKINNNFIACKSNIYKYRASSSPQQLLLDGLVFIHYSFKKVSDAFNCLCTEVKNNNGPLNN